MPLEEIRRRRDPPVSRIINIARDVRCNRFARGFWIHDDEIPAILNHNLYTVYGCKGRAEFVRTFYHVSEETCKGGDKHNVESRYVEVRLDSAVAKWINKTLGGALSMGTLGTRRFETWSSLGPNKNVTEKPSTLPSEAQPAETESRTDWADEVMEEESAQLARDSPDPSGEAQPTEDEGQTEDEGMEVKGEDDPSPPSAPRVNTPQEGASGQGPDVAPMRSNSPRDTPTDTAPTHGGSEAYEQRSQEIAALKQKLTSLVEEQAEEQRGKRTEEEEEDGVKKCIEKEKELERE